MTPVDDLQGWFDNTRNVLETAYMRATEPWKGSGMSGPFERWSVLRRPVADCLDHDGSFLDIGCANGYLLECSLIWTAERGVRIEPFGLDFSAPLVELAKERLPAYADNFYTANSFEWTPPRRFDFVRTELVYVPEEHEKGYLEHLLTNYLNPGGRLIVTNYAEGTENPARGLLPGSRPTRYLLERLEELGFPVLETRNAEDPEGRSGMRAAVLAAER